jgi:competence protein ComGC
MIFCRSRRRGNRRATTLLETLIVLFIIGIMLSLLLPAVERARSAAQNAMCKNNLHQLYFAVSHYSSIKKKLPNSPQPNIVSGWAIAVLPYMEEKALADALTGGPRINLPSIAQQISHRPRIMTCPFGSDEDSSVPNVPVSHYAYWCVPPDYFVLCDVPRASRIPWVQSPEINTTSLPRDEGPHDYGYFVADGQGDVRWTAGAMQ